MQIHPHPAGANVGANDCAERPPFSLGETTEEQPVASSAALARTFEVSPREKGQVPRSSRAWLPRLTDETALLRALGMDANEDGFAACPLPGHSGGTARLDRHDGELRFVCNCLGSPSQFASDTSWSSEYHRHLADAYHAIRTGRVLELFDPENVTTTTLTRQQRVYWRMLLCRDAGLLVPIDLPELPDDADDLLRDGRDLFAMMAARWIATDGSDETAFSERFVGREPGCQQGRCPRADQGAPRRGRDRVRPLRRTCREPRVRCWHLRALSKGNQ